MAVFISVTTSAFGDDAARRRPPQNNVRRPLRGIQLKEDTYAVLRARTATGEDIPFLDSSSPIVEDGIGRSAFYSNFLVQQIQESRVEKQQIIETFGEDYIYFFGERPRFINVTGILLNTKDFNWKSEFWENYERYLRGTRLVEQNARLYFYFDDVVIEGYIVSATSAYDTGSPYHLPFQFQMFVCNYAVLSTPGSVYFQQNAEAEDQTAGLAPDSEEAQKEAAQKAASRGSSGGLTSFLASAQQFFQTANLGVQRTLEELRNAFFGRRIVVPEGLGSSVYVAPIVNQASFQPAPTNQAIHTMSDEYVTRADSEAQYDEAEIQRVKKEQALRTPEELERKARAEFAKYGVDTSRRESTYALLGRGAFAAVQTMGAFGIRQVDGELGEVL